MKASNTAYQDFFGNEDELPAPIVKEDLTAPDFGAAKGGGQINFKEVEPDENAGEDMLNNMFGNVDESIDSAFEEEETGQDNEPNAAVHSDLDIDVENKAIEIDVEFEGEMLYEIWEDTRKLGHGKLYEYFVEKDISDIEEIHTKLKFQQTRTNYEHEVFIKIDQFINNHDKLKSEYIEAIPYSGKRKNWAIKCFEKLMPRLMGSKKMPLWMILIIVFVLPEIMLIVKLFSFKMEMPKVDIDIEGIKTELSKKEKKQQ